MNGRSRMYKKKQVKVVITFYNELLCCPEVGSSGTQALGGEVKPRILSSPLPMQNTPHNDFADFGRHQFVTTIKCHCCGGNYFVHPTVSDTGHKYSDHGECTPTI